MMVDDPPLEVVVAVRMAEFFFSAHNELRCHPASSRIRAMVGDETVVDTTRALLVWEPRRIVPSYAVPVEDVRAAVIPAAAPEAVENPRPMGDGPPVLDPRNPFAVHSCPGESRTIQAATRELRAAGFSPSDGDLSGYIVLDWAAFDRWMDEDEDLVAHPRDPFKRIDTRRSSRHVVVEIDGQQVAESRRPTLLFETYLPTRYYLPAQDVDEKLLSPTDSRTACAYKGVAEYWAAAGDTELRDVAWTYRHPLHDAVPVQDMIAFFNERVDITVDGQPQQRPRTPWS
jgi:uncharacterized protein (DUF427 family)